MKFILTTTIICFTLFAVNAQDKGIEFQNGLSWAQVKQKAKAENKYIFVDCYTTWCVPCKVMATEVFPQKEVSDFFNDKFISVALQFDETKKDDANTKRWYKEVKQIEKDYKVNAYPTYLFFTPDGALAHSIVGGWDAKTFINKAKEALDPKTQLVNLKKQYADGNRSPEFLKIFIDALGRSWDSQVTEVINVYLPTQKNLLTKENLQLIARGTARSTDPGFKTVQQHSKEFDAANGPGRSGGLIGDIAFDELVLPIVRINGAKVTNGGMYYYTGEINKNVNWDEVKAKLDAQYPQLADEIVAKSKVRYYRDLENWPKYTEQAAVYVKQYGNDNHDQVMTYANDIMLFTDDKACLRQAADWSKEVLATPDGANTSWYVNVYARLLYKLGHTDEALTVINDAITKLGDKAYGLKDTQEKMKKGGDL
ncbi:thioredoxin family protein [Mucilaginibacter rigui]|uniref:Thioredoxin family protein n=1 Tax=Mucilaginibacter rigui TaxID=534635 RepID=A0ABR7X6C9_9SPHI|nr:thioredoxin fold domain-containing protein [Mucilaginibacter rigui]MBD1385155.1 thioredoxin family protein [Mucilaginibacter rigui]